MIHQSSVDGGVPPDSLSHRNGTAPSGPPTGESKMGGPDGFHDQRLGLERGERAEKHCGRGGGADYQATENAAEGGSRGRG